MTLPEYESLLTDLVARKVISLDDAAILLSRFVAGDIDATTLPLPIAQVGNKDDRAAAILLLLLLGMRRQQKRISPRKRERFRELLRLTYTRESARLATGLVANALTITQWHADSNALIGRMLAAQWLAGSGSLGESDNSKAIDEQRNYLYLFAGDLHAHRELQKPRSEPYTYHRLMMYGGAMRGAWFRGNESVSEGDGWVCRYNPVDDRRTCRACSRARGYYLPGDGPYPGEVCLGGDFCRCYRVLVYDPVIYGQLTGRVMA